MSDPPRMEEPSAEQAAIAEVNDSAPAVATWVPVDKDALSRHNARYRRVVEHLSRISDEEFSPFKSFMNRMLDELPVRARNGILAVGHRCFLVNYLFADEFKLLTIRHFGRKSICDFGRIRQPLMDYVLEKCAAEGAGDDQQESRQEKTLRQLLGKERYAFLERALASMTEELSPRCRNVVLSFQGDFIEEFVYRGRTIEQLGAAGKKTFEGILPMISRLSNMVQDLLAHPDRTEAELARSHTLKGILGDLKYALLQKSLREMTKGLSVRARNAVNTYRRDFIEDFLHRGKDLFRLNQTGKMTVSELETVISKLQEMTVRLIERELTPQEMKLLEYRLVFDECYDLFSNNYYMNKGHLPMFHLLENLIEKYLRSKRWRILNYRHPLLGDHPVRSLEEVAKEFSYTQERCRQICYACEKELNEGDKDRPSYLIVNYAMIISCREEWGYAVEALSKGKSMILPGELLPLLKEEESGLSLDMALLAVSLVMKEEFALIGRQPIPVTGESYNHWKGSYLIRRELAEAFRFCEMLQLVQEIQASLRDDVLVEAKEMVRDYFCQAWNSYDPDKLEAVTEILCEMLRQEFDMHPDEQGRFLLKGKMRILPGNFIYETLREMGDPMSVEELFERYNALRPGLYKGPSSLKAFVTRDPRLRWIVFGSLVGLA